MPMPYPNYHHCDELAKAEHREGNAIHINHNGNNWNMTIHAWSDSVTLQISFCPFCGKEFP